MPHISNETHAHVSEMIKQLLGAWQVLTAENQELKERLANIYKAGYSDASINQARVDEAVEEEQKRWCEELEFLHTEYGADCSGCDSGDPLDCVEVEIRQAIEAAEHQAVMQCHQIASSHEFGPDAAKTIRETFALEI